MKDDRLEKEFEEYFKGINTPDDITGGAKKYVKPKNSFMPKFVKLASIAASFVLVFAVALTIVLKSDFNSPSEGNHSFGNDNADSNTAPPASDSPAEVYYYYSDSDLSLNEANAYSISSLDKSLKFIESLAIADNASVNKCEAAYKDNKLALVKADVSLTSGLNRDETKIFVEFTDRQTVHSGLAGYYDGYTHYYRGAKYYLTEGVAENGEPEFKLHVNYNGVKYYFNVTSSDTRAYEKYLNLIVK